MKRRSIAACGRVKREAEEVLMAEGPEAKVKREEEGAAEEGDEDAAEIENASIAKDEENASSGGNLEEEEEEERLVDDEEETDGAGDNSQSTTNTDQLDPIPMVMSLLNTENGQPPPRMSSMGRRLPPPRNRDDPLLQLVQRHYDPRDTRHFNGSLVEEVNRHPALYDYTNDEYKSTDARNRHWEEVAAHLEQPVEFVRTRWKTLRDRFKKEVRRQQQLDASGLAWQHYEDMLFLLPFIRDKLEEIPAAGGEGTKGSANRSQPQALYQCGRSTAIRANGTGAQQHHHHSTSSAHSQPPMNSCTAAILDLAMSAVTRFSPTEEHLQSGSSSSSSNNNQLAEKEPRMKEDASTGGTSSSSSSSSVGAGKCGTAIVTTGAMRPFAYATSGGEERQWAEDERDEDELFCRIVLKKLAKMGDERMKDYAKAKIMDLLVDIQHGGSAAEKQK